MWVATVRREVREPSVDVLEEPLDGKFMWMRRLPKTPASLGSARDVGNVASDSESDFIVASDVGFAVGESIDGGYPAVVAAELIAGDSGDWLPLNAG